MFSFFLGKKEENTFKVLWEKINKNIKNKLDITELNDNFKSFHKLIKEELNNQNKSIMNNKKESSNESNKLLFLQTNNVLSEISKYPLNYPDSRPITLEFLSSFLNALKYQKFLFEKNDDLFILLQNLVLNLKKELEQKTFKFNIKNEFAYLLNSITRILLNYPSYISFFIIKTKRMYSNEEYDDFIIFSCLLKLLQIDQTINNYIYRKYIRRSLIVSLSFDEINKDDNDYLFNESFVVEILINKLCNLYQMLPKYFDIDKDAKSLEPSININISMNCLKSTYFEYKDYIIFFNKIINCFTNDKFKDKIENYFFNKFLLENVLPNLTNHNIKIIRTHLQYLITMLNLSKNNTMIINTISYFLLGINDNIITNDSNNTNVTNNSSNDDNGENDEDKSISISINGDPIYMNYLLSNYNPNKVKSLILNNLHKKNECINIVIFEIFNIFFQKKPYLMVRHFVKPYTDYVINKSNNKTKFILGNSTSYPMSNQLMILLNKFNIYETEFNMANNIECSMFKNLCYYINYDIDFYNYYLNNKKKEELILNQSNQSINNNEMSSFRINEDSFSEQSSNQETLEDNIIKGLNPNFIKNLLTPKEKKANKKKENKSKKENNLLNEKEVIIKDIFRNEIYVKEDADNYDSCININYDINFDVVNNFKNNKKDLLYNYINNSENIFDNKDDDNILFMKNIHHKLVNFDTNSNVENIVLFHLIITIISIPNFSFDTDLLRCNLVLLDNDDKSKYSFLTLFKYHSQEIIKKLKIIENESKFILILKEFNLNKDLSNIEFIDKKQQEFKTGLDFKGFNNNEKMTEKDKDKNKIINWVIFCEFIKEFISCISHKYKFEDIIENLFVFYSEQLDEFYNDNMIDDDEENENEDRCDEIDNENHFQSNKYQNMYSNTNSNNIELDDNEP